MNLKKNPSKGKCDELAIIAWEENILEYLVHFCYCVWEMTSMKTGIFLSAQMTHRYCMSTRQTYSIYMLKESAPGLPWSWGQDDKALKASCPDEWRGFPRWWQSQSSPLIIQKGCSCDILLSNAPSTMAKTTSQGSRIVQGSSRNSNFYYSNQELQCQRHPIVLSFTSAFSSQHSRV